MKNDEKKRKNMMTLLHNFFFRFSLKFLIFQNSAVTQVGSRFGLAVSTLSKKTYNSVQSYKR